MTSPAPLSIFTPGRLCLFGEHSDWAAQYGLHSGLCLVIGTDQGLWGTARAADNFTVQTLVSDRAGRPTGRTRQMACPFSADKLLEAAKDQDEFFRYCAGVACQILSRYNAPGGLELHITAMDLPLRKGVSSSAAVCILVARAFNEVYGLNMLPHELMEVAYQGEKLTGSQCGRMDQACIYGKTPVLLTFTRDIPIRVEPVFTRGSICMFFVDLAGHKNTIKILRDLGEAYLKSQPLQKALGPQNEQIVRAAYRALETGNGGRLGRLMTESQEMFDSHVAPHCPQELASPLLHKLLNWPELKPHIFGGKGVGSQGDGTAQFVARDAESRAAAMELIHRDMPNMRCFELNIAPNFSQKPAV